MKYIYYTSTVQSLEFDCFTEMRHKTGIGMHKLIFGDHPSVGRGRWDRCVLIGGNYSRPNDSVKTNKAYLIQLHTQFVTSARRFVCHFM